MKKRTMIMAAVIISILLCAGCSANELEYDANLGYDLNKAIPWRHRCGNGHACLAHGGIRPHGHNGRLPYGKLRQFPHNRARARSA